MYSSAKERNYQMGAVSKEYGLVACMIGSQLKWVVAGKLAVVHNNRVDIVR